MCCVVTQCNVMLCNGMEWKKSGYLDSGMVATVIGRPHKTNHIYIYIQNDRFRFRFVFSLSLVSMLFYLISLVPMSKNAIHIGQSSWTSIAEKKPAAIDIARAARMFL